jgi:hypothetical protein
MRSATLISIERGKEDQGQEFRTRRRGIGMKLRIKGDSLRLRIAPSELTRLMETGRIEETVHFGLKEDARLTYALEHAGVEVLTVRHEGTQVAVVLPTAMARGWADGDGVGLYGSVVTASGLLDVAVEKDWACLDRDDAENADTFPHPNLGTNC